MGYSDSSKRKETCVAFNSFFRIFREERSLLSEFYWRLPPLPWPVSNHCTMNLSIKGSPFIGASECSKQTADYVEKILVHNSSILQKYSSKRWVPKELKGGYLRVCLFCMASLSQTESEVFFELNWIAKIDTWRMWEFKHNQSFTNFTVMPRAASIEFSKNGLTRPFRRWLKSRLHLGSVWTDNTFSWWDEMWNIKDSIVF